MRQAVAAEKQEMDFHQYLSIARTLNDLRKRILKALVALGFSDFAYTRVNAQGDIEGNLTSHENALLEAYYRGGLYQHDMLLQYGRVNELPIFLSDIHEYLFSAPFTSESIEKNRTIQALAKQFGYLDFYHIPLPRNEQGRALLSISAKYVDRLEFQRRVSSVSARLTALAGAIDEVSIDKYPDLSMGGKDDRGGINPRPLMLLTLIATENLTIVEAAARMGISLHTANKQMAAAKQALGASTQASAVYLAMKEGLIDSGD